MILWLSIIIVAAVILIILFGLRELAQRDEQVTAQQPLSWRNHHPGQNR